MRDAVHPARAHVSFRRPDSGMAAGDEAGYITGAVVPIDGGRTAGVAETSHIGMDAAR